jgi:peptidyl-tRNA hydrolase, PTH1 family
MKIIVGLGNPGESYALTRHNVGFHVVDEVAGRLQMACGRHRFHGLVGEGAMSGERVVLVKPQTYMNDSGMSVREAVDWHKCSLLDLLVVCDDFQLPLGAVRMKPQGSAGGHNGMASIVAALGTEEFPRLRLGIGVEGVRRDKEFVLSAFRAEELASVRDMIVKAADAVVMWAQSGLARCMQTYNTKPKREESPKEEEGT